MSRWPLSDFAWSIETLNFQTPRQDIKEKKIIPI